MLREDYLMHSEIYVKSTSDISGDITLTDDYLVIKGGHYNIMDWYVKKLQSDVAISTKDILSMGFITMNSKRVLVLSVIFMSIFLTSKLCFILVCLFAPFPSYLHKRIGLPFMTLSQFIGFRI